MDSATKATTATTSASAEKITMTPEDFLHWAHDVSFAAGMNQQYYQYMMGFWGFIDSGVKIVVALFALASVVVGATDKIDKKAKELSKPKKWWRWPSWCVRRVWILFPAWKLSVRLSAWSAIFAIVLLVVPTSDKTSLYSGLYEQWTSVRSEVDRLVLDFKTVEGDKQEVTERYVESMKSLRSREAEIESKEPSPWMFLVEHCYDAEVRRRFGDTPPDEQPLATDSQTAQFGIPQIQ